MSMKGGMTAGFVATVVLSLLTIVKSALGLMPQLNPIQDIVHIAALLFGVTLPAPFGWVGHFLIGTVAWGNFYALLEPGLPGAPPLKGLVMGTIAWLAMMIFFMPLAGHGLFGLELGFQAVLATLVLHLVYGLVLGIVFPHVAGEPARSEVMPG